MQLGSVSVTAIAGKKGGLHCRNSFSRVVLAHRQMAPDQMRTAARAQLDPGSTARDYFVPLCWLLFCSTCSGLSAEKPRCRQATYGTDHTK